MRDACRLGLDALHCRCKFSRCGRRCRVGFAAAGSTSPVMATVGSATGERNSSVGVNAFCGGAAVAVTGSTEAGGCGCAASDALSSPGAPSFISVVRATSAELTNEGLGVVPVHADAVRIEAIMLSTLPRITNPDSFFHNACSFIRFPSIVSICAYSRYGIA